MYDIQAIHTVYIKCIHTTYTKSLSLLASAPLNFTEQLTARSENDRSGNQKWSFKRQQQIDCFDKSNL